MFTSRLNLSCDSSFVLLKVKQEILLLLNLLQVIYLHKDLQGGDCLNEFVLLLAESAFVDGCQLLARFRVQPFAEGSQVLVQESPDLGLSIAEISFLFVVETGFTEDFVDFIDNGLHNGTALFAYQFKKPRDKQLFLACSKHFKNVSFHKNGLLFETLEVL